ncbi:MAG: hypothetical protein HYX27_27725 [Acidobacteria bacterium]|nr:hypothetical protein [Acidobacteriota bacterium]
MTFLAAVLLSGIWVGQVPARNGESVDIAFEFKQEGTKLTGKLYGDYKSSPIVEGIVAGDLVTFVVAATEQAGNQINESRLRFTGSMKDGQLELTRERESVYNAGNGGGAQTRNGLGAKATFRLKKLA